MEETRRTKVFKIEIMIVNHDKLSEKEVVEALEESNYPNDCIMPRVMKIESREVDWNDEHPLNNRLLAKGAYDKLFLEETEDK
jgi:hypothetical protein